MEPTPSIESTNCTEPSSKRSEPAAVRPAGRVNPLRCVCCLPVFDEGGRFTGWRKVPFTEVFPEEAAKIREEQEAARAMDAGQ